MMRVPQWRDGEYGLTDDGPVRIDIPPDRQSSFEPLLIRRAGWVTS